MQQKDYDPETWGVIPVLLLVAKRLGEAIFSKGLVFFICEGLIICVQCTILGVTSTQKTV